MGLRTNTCVQRTRDTSTYIVQQEMLLFDTGRGASVCVRLCTSAECAFLKFLHERSARTLPPSFDTVCTRCEWIKVPCGEYRRVISMRFSWATRSSFHINAYASIQWLNVCAFHRTRLYEYTLCMENHLVASLPTKVLALWQNPWTQTSLVETKEHDDGTSSHRFKNDI